MSPAPSPVVLVTMPWDALHTPSIRLGILKAVADREEIPCEAMHLHLAAMEHFAQALGAAGHAFGVSDYARVADNGRQGWGDWAFAVPPYRTPPPPERDPFLAPLRASASEDDVLRLIRVRDAASAFLEKAADEVLARRPQVVGFSTTFSQTIPSVALATILKARDPSLRVVFGGANCEGPMGPALLRMFPAIDVVVRGEAERLLAPLLRALLAGAPAPRLPGLCVREGAEVVAVPPDGEPVAMEEVPAPDYDDYFDRLERASFQGELAPHVSLPFESARGCWWGAKHHCTFCGLNGETIAFRAKSAARVERDVLELAERYERLAFEAVDNILPMTYFRSLFPRLAESGLDLRLFYETKANLSRDQLRALRDAGVRAIQPGIESFSASILRLMDKGTTGLQNVRLLKWCAEYGIHPFWSVLYGFPGEDPAEYARLADLVPSLTHLAPPLGLRPLEIDRFSPYHARPGDYGLEIVGPSPFYAMLYPGGEAAAADVAYTFRYRHVDGRDPERYVASARVAIDRWKSLAGRGALVHHRGPGFLRIVDTRADLPQGVTTLGAVQARIYLRCDAGATAASIARDLAGDEDAPSADEVKELLDELALRRLCMVEGDRYLSLSTPATPDRGARRASRDEPEERSPLVTLHKKAS